jgi:glycine betaine/choline ABC-type transport system substrate-binding protein
MTRRQILFLPLAPAAAVLASCQQRRPAGDPSVLRVGCKNFNEQFILGEIIAQSLEAAGVKVERRFGFGSTALIHGALANGQIDLYVEYTGTGAEAVLEMRERLPRDRVLEALRNNYERRFQATWLSPLGFENSYAIVVRQEDAEARGWRRVSDLQSASGSLRAGFTSEFFERLDGYPRLRTHYGFGFGNAITLDAGLMYDALRRTNVDLISGFSSDGRIDASRLVALEDDRSFFPAYDAVPVVRLDALQRFPALRPALEGLAGRFSLTAMRAMNFEVDTGATTAAEIARKFLAAPASRSLDMGAARPRATGPA